MSFPFTVVLNDRLVKAISSTKQHPLGTRGHTVDGRVFRYAQNGGTALAAHYVCGTAAEGPASTATDQFFYSAYVAGATYVKLSLSTVALPVLSANYFQDGYLLVNSTDLAYNQMVRVSGNEALVSSTALGQQTGIWLDVDGLDKTVDTATCIAKLVANPYAKVVVNPIAATTGGYVIGVTPVAVTASYYFWLQTWGPALVLNSEGNAITIDLLAGRPIGPSTAVAGGACRPITASASGYIPMDTDSGKGWVQRIGTLMTCAPADTFFCLVNLTIAP